MKKRYFPTGAIIVRPKDMDNVEIGLYENEKGMLCAIGYRGKKTNCDFQYGFPDLESRERCIARFIKECKELETIRAERKQSRKANTTLNENPCKVGDIFYTSWGYEQTNIEFFIISEVRGSFVVIKEMQTDIEMVKGCSDMSGNKTPRLNALKPNGETYKKKVLTYDGGKNVSLRIEDYRYAYLWDGQPKYCSWYA